MRIRLSAGTGAPAIEVAISSLVILTDEGNAVAAAVANGNAVVWTTCTQPEFASFVESQGLMKREVTKMRLGSHVSQQDTSRKTD